ncbi:MAG: HPr(Ser) kinase/phosphatase [Candidatus Marinimicrobia bacterium]|nr:HPr(Ser) kinase/phosphatase [Candidatus Neomarinimicrobiota bacterium]
MSQLLVRRFFNDMRERLVMDSVYENEDDRLEIVSSKVNNPGLELAGFWEHFKPENIQIISRKEMNFLEGKSDRNFRNIFKKLFTYKIPCLIFVDDMIVDKRIIRLARILNIPLFSSRLDSTEFLKEIGGYLYKEFAPRISVHGSLMDIHGVGILFTGRSGIGKSEVALDLVERGHRLVADDVVNIEKAADNILMGYGETLLQNTLEIRGVGIIDIRKAFGIRAVRTRKRVELCIELLDWSAEENYERFGLDTETKPLLDISLPFIKLPIFPGKNITVITEVIALNYMLKYLGEDPAKELQERIRKEINSKSAGMDDKRFSGDYE